MANNTLPQRKRVLQAAGSSQGSTVVLGTYGMIAAVKNSDDVATQLAPPGVGWDCVILDEGHKIKNTASRCLGSRVEGRGSRVEGWGLGLD